jgi:hypothetical protein
MEPHARHDKQCRPKTRKSRIGKVRDTPQLDENARKLGFSAVNAFPSAATVLESAVNQADR